MNWMQDNEWENFLKSKVEEFEFPYEEKYWEEVSKRLPSPKNARWQFQYWGIRILVFFVGLFFVYWGIWVLYLSKKFNPKLVNSPNTSLQTYSPSNTNNNEHHMPNIKPNFNKIKQEFIDTNHHNSHFKSYTPNSEINQEHNYVQKMKQSKTNQLKDGSFSVQDINHAQKKMNAQKMNRNNINGYWKRKQSAQLQIWAEKVSAVSKTIIIFKILKEDAIKHIPLENAYEFSKKLEVIPTKNLIAYETNFNLKESNKELEKTSKKRFFDRKWDWGIGGGFFSSKILRHEDWYFRHYVSSFIKYSLSPSIFVQALPYLSYGNYWSLKSSVKSNSLALHSPLELGYKRNRHSVSAGIQYDYFFLNPEEKQELKPSRMNYSFSYQSQYQQFMLRLNTQYSPNISNKIGSSKHELRILVGLYYLFP